MTNFIVHLLLFLQSQRSHLFILLFSIVLFTTGLMAAAAVYDFLKLRIPNIISVLVIMCFIGAYTLHSFLGTNASFQGLQSHLIAFGVTFVVMIILFFLGLFGGGDAKLIPAIALWVGLEGLPMFFMVTSIVGGCLAVMGLLLTKTSLSDKILPHFMTYEILKEGWFGALSRQKNVVPYGIAIASGGIGAFRSLGYLP